MFCILNAVLNNGNWTEWSAIWPEIIRVISKSNERTARVRFEITSMISDQNCRHKVQLPLYCIHFEIAQIQDLVSSKISLMQYWASLKLNSSIFGGEKTRVLETKVAEFATWYSLSFIFLQLDWLLFTSLEIWLVVLFSVWPPHWLGKWCDLFVNKSLQLEPIRLQGPPAISKRV